MRNHRPLVLDVRIDNAYALLVAVILFHDLGVKRGKSIARQRLSSLDHLMHAQFELCELGLTEDGALNALQIIAQQRKPRRVILDLFQHVVVQQRLVES